MRLVRTRTSIQAAATLCRRTHDGPLVPQSIKPGSCAPVIPLARFDIHNDTLGNIPAGNDLAAQRGSISFFMKSEGEKGLPCEADQPKNQAAPETTAMGHSSDAPQPLFKSPRRAPPPGAASGNAPNADAPQQSIIAPKTVPQPQKIQRPATASPSAKPSEKEPQRSSLPTKLRGAHLEHIRTPAAATETPTIDAKPGGSKAKIDGAEAKEEEAKSYYDRVLANQQPKVDSKEMWSKIHGRSNIAAPPNEEMPPGGFPLEASEVDYARMDQELKDKDKRRYDFACYAFPDNVMRRNYLAMWQLSMSLHKCRWQAMELHKNKSEGGMGSAGVTLKASFWRDSCFSIIEKQQMVRGQFVDTHPVLRPFAQVVANNPQLTRTFLRGFIDAKLKVFFQPSSLKNLIEYYDKFYGYFYYSQLEMLGVKNDHAEHMAMHIGRAVGITLHSVMLWKRYAELDFTMLPADLCAEYMVNLALLKKPNLAGRDPRVRMLLEHMLSVAKAEMVRAEKISHLCPIEAWPIIFECTYPNYHFGYLQGNRYNVSARFADNNIENAGYVWYVLKKQWQWGYYQSIPRLVAEKAPLPYLGVTLQRTCKYKEYDPNAADKSAPDQGHGHGKI